MQQKRIPMRKCSGCGAMKPKKELVRVVKSPQGEISLDLTGKKSGRGAYICRDVACLKKVRKSGRLAHNLACEISAEVYEKMEAELDADLGDRA